MTFLKDKIEIESFFGQIFVEGAKFDLNEKSDWKAQLDSKIMLKNC